ncbi:MAG TPA: hypothetical protein VJ744_03095 [Gaiellaceae bacterium]|nr:hypothetical protein [Gaiellaceae bacterium]
MNRILVLLVVALLGLTACGAGEDADSGSGGPAESTEPEPTALPDVARVVCDENGARLETTSVRPQPDGIHFEIVNETDSERSVAIQNAQGTGTGMGVPAGTSTQIVDVEPGALTVSCTDPATEPGAGVALEVVDQDGIWVSTRLGCAEQFSQVVDYIQGASGETTDPLEAAKKAVEGFGLEPDDVFERAGYPDTDTARVRMVRDGEPIAVVDLIDDGTGKWLVSMVTGCSSLEN